MCWRVLAASGWGIAGSLIYFANHLQNARLIIGAAGKTGDENANGMPTRGAASYDVIGHVAIECMARVKVPLMVVKQPWQVDPHHPSAHLSSPIPSLPVYSQPSHPAFLVSTNHIQCHAMPCHAMPCHSMPSYHIPSYPAAKAPRWRAQPTRPRPAKRTQREAGAQYFGLRRRLIPVSAGVQLRSQFAPWHRQADLPPCHNQKQGKHRGTGKDVVVGAGTLITSLPQVL